MKRVVGIARGRAGRVGLVTGVIVAAVMGLSAPASAQHEILSGSTVCSNGNLANNCSTTTTHPVTTTTKKQCGCTTTTTVPETTTTVADSTTTTAPVTTTSIEYLGSTTIVTTSTTQKHATTTLGEQGSTVPTTQPTSIAVPTLPHTGSGTTFPVIFGGICVAAGAALALRKRGAWSRSE